MWLIRILGITLLQFGLDLAEFLSGKLARIDQAQYQPLCRSAKESLNEITQEIAGGLAPRDERAVAVGQCFRVMRDKAGAFHGLQQSEDRRVRDLLATGQLLANLAHS